jgi:RNA polymerase sigma-70 factor (ECF subfamily)
LERTDEELMAAYVAGDRAAFADLFRRYAAPLLRMLARQLQADDARDLLQQTFLHLHRSRSDFRPGSLLRPWLYTIALNLKRQHYRKHKRELLSDDPRDFEPKPAAGSASDFELTREVRQAVRGLPQDQQEVIVLHWMEGMPFQDVAQVVGASVSAVKVRAHRGYTAMRKILGDKLQKDEALE